MVPPSAAVGAMDEPRPLHAWRVIAIAPRALAFQVRSINGHLRRLRQASGTGVAELPEALETELQQVVRLFGGDEKSWRHEGLALTRLRQAIDAAAGEIETLSEAITRAYFSHVPAAQAVGSPAGR